MNVNTVNVVEYIGDSLSSIRSFTDDEQGNKEANEMFGRIAKENGGDESEMEFYLEEGYYETGDYQLFITHSS